MKLYHSVFSFLIFLVLIITACSASLGGETLLDVRLRADDRIHKIQVAPGSTVQDALDQADLSLGPLDRIEPDVFVKLEDGMEITITRVYEEFEVEEVVVPFEQQLQPSEFLPEGDQQPLQLGENGIREITYRVVYEDGIEVSRTEIKSLTIKEPVPQIMLVGVQSSFTPLPIPGRLAYLSDGNAWVMEGTTANREPIITSGDLDGRIFDLSSDGEWLLFTRHVEGDETINSLWAVNVDDPEVEIDLQMQNVIHFAEWRPGSTTWVAVSTWNPETQPLGGKPIMTCS